MNMAGLDEFYLQNRQMRQDDVSGTIRLPSVPDSPSPTSSRSSSRLDRMAAHVNLSDNEYCASSEKFVELGLQLSGLTTQYIISHPFIVLKRQCQVSYSAIRYHTTPFTLAPIAFNLYRSQGIGSFWKGIGSSLIIRGMLLGIEDFTSKITPWPKEIDRNSSLKMIGEHLLLKAFSTAILTPFYSASLVESVQSDVASEPPGLLDIFQEGFARLSWYAGQSGRLIPVLVLMPPTVLHGVAHYIVTTIVKGLSMTAMKYRRKKIQKVQGAIPKNGSDSFEMVYCEQISLTLGHLAADVLLYPLETIMNRLHLQGTRSIIDNLDNGQKVIPIMTRYEGALDCLIMICRDEGTSGLFKGIGALILQYAIHFALIKLSLVVVQEAKLLLSQDDVSSFLERQPEATNCPSDFKKRSKEKLNH